MGKKIIFFAFFGNRFIVIFINRARAHAQTCTLESRNSAFAAITPPKCRAYLSLLFVDDEPVNCFIYTESADNTRRSNLHPTA